jgi:hypothetical protein
MLEILRADFARIPELLSLPALEQPAPEEAELVVPEPALAAEPQLAAAPPFEPAAEPEREPEPTREPDTAQLGLF